MQDKESLATLSRPSGAVYSKLHLRKVRIPPGGLFHS